MNEFQRQRLERLNTLGYKGPVGDPSVHSAALIGENVENMSPEAYIGSIGHNPLIKHRFPHLFNREAKEKNKEILTMTGDLKSKEGRYNRPSNSFDPIPEKRMKRRPNENVKRVEVEAFTPASDTRELRMLEDLFDPDKSFGYSPSVPTSIEHDSFTPSLTPEYIKNHLKRKNEERTYGEDSYKQQKKLSYSSFINPEKQTYDEGYPNKGVGFYEEVINMAKSIAEDTVRGFMEEYLKKEKAKPAFQLLEVKGGQKILKSSDGKYYMMKEIMFEGEKVNVLKEVKIKKS